MRKILVLIVFFALLSSTQSLFSQNTGNNGIEEPTIFEFGVKGALSLPSFFWLEDNSWNGATMFLLQGAAWAYSTINISEDIGIQLEAGYCGKGASLDASDGSLKWRFHYIEIPLLVKWMFRESHMNFWVGSGGYYSYFLGGTYNFDVPGSEWTGKGKLTTGNNEIITEIRQHDIGLLFTAGYASGKFIYELRFPIGLTPVLAFTPEDQITYGRYRKALNSGLMFSVGYRF